MPTWHRSAGDAAQRQSMAPERKLCRSSVEGVQQRGALVQCNDEALRHDAEAGDGVPVLPQRICEEAATPARASTEVSFPYGPT